jgi:hypothetical protein
MAYLKGTMPEREMYALEKQALEDPILADAIEGYALLHQEEKTVNLGILKSDINSAKVVAISKSTNRKKLIYRIAAAAALVGVIFGLANLFFKNEKINNPKAAVNNSGKIDSSANNQTQTNTSEIVNSTTDTITVKDIAKPKTIFINPDQLDNLYQKGSYTDVVSVEQGVDTALKDNKLEDLSSNQAPIAASPSLEKEEPKENTTNSSFEEIKQAPPVVYSSNTNNANFNNVFVKKEVALDKLVLAKTNSNIGKPNYNTYLFNYKITNDDGNFLPFANISIPNDQISTYSRVDGRFGLFSADSVLYVNIKANGYLPKTIPLTPSVDYRNIVLVKDNSKANIATDQVVVAKAKSTSTNTSVDQDIVQTKIEIAEPIDGIDNYKAYILNNFQNTTNGPKGEVVLSFDIDAQGQPSNIKVDKSLNPVADQEAIRILSQGPKWKSKKKKMKKGKIVFKL